MIKITDISKMYEIEDGKLIRNHRTCPKCGPSYFLADHYDRSTCGHCGYTVFKRKGKKGAATVARRRRSPRKRTKSN